MTNHIRVRVIAVLTAVLLLAMNVASAEELIAPSRSLNHEGKSEGKLMLFSEPPGLAASLDGKSLGKTPISIDEVNAGPHRLRIDGQETDMVIEADKTTAISLFKGHFVKIPEVEETSARPAENEIAPAAETAPRPATTEEYQPPALSPIEHYRMFGYY